MSSMKTRGHFDEWLSSHKKRNKAKKEENESKEGRKRKP
jgi:hypothetical protein